MKFCSDCGQALTVNPRPAKGRAGLYCEQCRRRVIHHPKLLVAAFIHCGDRLLWMRRRLQPQAGYWAIPAGFLEQGESLPEGAARELFEETGVVVPPEQLQLFMMGTISFISEVYVAFRAEVDSLDCKAGIEALDVGFFSRHELDWDQVAYPAANNSILRAYDDIERRQFGVYHAQMTDKINDLLPVRSDA